jgi:hypothetical protein
MTSVIVKQEVLKVRLTAEGQPTIKLNVPAPVKVKVAPLGTRGLRGLQGIQGPPGPQGPATVIDPGDLTLIFDNQLI